MLNRKSLWRQAFVCFTLLWVSQVFAHGKHGISFHDALQLTVDTNPEVLRTIKARQAEEQGVRVAKGGYYPSVDLNAGYGKEWSKNPTVRADGHRGFRKLYRKESGVLMNQMLFDGWLTRSEVERRTGLLHALSHQVDADSQDRALAASQAYIEVLRLQALTRIAQANLDAHRHVYGLIKKRDQKGLSRKSDLRQSQGRLALARANLRGERSRLRDAQITFRREIGAAPLRLPVPKWYAVSRLPRSLHSAMHTALRHHPRLKEAKADVAEAIGQFNVAKSPFYPRLDLQVGASHNRDLDGSKGVNADKFVMLRANYNILRGGSDLARKRETAFLVEEARQVLANTRRQVKESMRFSWNSWITAKRRLGPLRVHMEASGRVVDAYREQFKLGKRTQLDLLDAKNEYFLARIAYVDDVFKEVEARYRILNSMGRLTRALGVRLPEEAFWPNDHHDQWI